MKFIQASTSKPSTPWASGRLAGLLGPTLHQRLTFFERTLRQGCEMSPLSPLNYRMTRSDRGSVRSPAITEPSSWGCSAKMRCQRSQRSNGRPNLSVSDSAFGWVVDLCLEDFWGRRKWHYLAIFRYMLFQTLAMNHNLRPSLQAPIEILYRIYP
ncbi:hypothetical protein BJX99DRAFT_39577 [Aspergillus californicus]